MGGHTTDPPVTVTSNGVEVSKRLDTDTYPLPTIIFEFESTRVETLSLELVEQLPDSCTVQDIGFHPDHNGQGWSVDDGMLHYECMLDPSTKTSTLYAIRATDPDFSEILDREPIIQVTQSSSTGPESPFIDAVEATKVSHPAGEGVNEAISRESVKKGISDTPPDHLAVAASEASDDPEDGSTVVEQFISDVQHGRVSDRQLADLQLIFHPGEGSFDARLSWVQTEVSNMEAYIDALEAFLDDRGGGEQLIAEFDDRLEHLESHTETLQKATENQEDRLDTLQSTLTTLEKSFQQIEDDFDTLYGSVDRIGDELETALPEDDVTGALDEIREKLESVEAWQANVEAAFDNVYENDTADER